LKGDEMILIQVIGYLAAILGLILLGWLIKNPDNMNRGIAAVYSAASLSTGMCLIMDSYLWFFIGSIPTTLVVMLIFARER
jgi:hypothetical protein